MRIIQSKTAAVVFAAAVAALSVTSAFAGRLSLGDKGEPVRDLQQRLKEQNFFSGEIDGKFGQKTYDAVKAFQKAKGLKVDGKVGDKTWALLTSDKAPNPTVRRGDKGDAVRELQKALKLEVDGKFGAGTEKALKAFQKDHNITADGVAGQSTWAALGNP